MSWSEMDEDSITRLSVAHGTAPCRKRTEYGVRNDDEENVEQRSRHVLVG